MVELIKLIPEGASVISVIVVVVLFLKQQREQHRSIREMAETFNIRIKESIDGFQSQIDRLANQIFENEKNTQSQVQSLFNNFIAVSKETVQAVVELKGTIQALHVRMDQVSKSRYKGEGQA